MWSGRCRSSRGGLLRRAQPGRAGSEFAAEEISRQSDRPVEYRDLPEDAYADSTQHAIDPAYKMMEPLRGGITWPAFIAGALVMLGTYGLLLVVAIARLGLEPVSAAMILGGVVYLIGSTGRPRLMYLVLRNGGWFRSIESDAAIQAWLLTAGVLLTLAGGLWAMLS